MQKQVIEPQPPLSPMARLFIDRIREVAKIADAKHTIGHRPERCTSELAHRVGSLRCRNTSGVVGNAEVSGARRD